MDINGNKSRFISLVKDNIHRNGIDGLMSYIESSDFYIAPASIRYHENYEGGLCEHSLKVYDHMNVLNECYHMNIPAESITICSLFHDLCKINCYAASTKNVKDENGNWHTEPWYKWDEKEKYGGHGSKSVYIVQFFMPLNFEEAVAINCHMGPDGAKTDAVMDAFRDHPFAYLLHTADMIATIPAFDVFCNRGIVL